MKWLLATKTHFPLSFVPIKCELDDNDLLVFELNSHNSSVLKIAKFAGLFSLIEGMCKFKITLGFWLVVFIKVSKEMSFDK